MCDLFILQVPSPEISIVFSGSTFLRVAGEGEKLNDEYFKVKLLSSNSAK